MPKNLKDFLWENFSISRDHFLTLIAVYDYMARENQKKMMVGALEVPAFLEDYVELCNCGDVDITLEEAAEKVAA